MKKAKQLKFIDVHDSDLTAIVYSWFFAMIEIDGNDRTYEYNHSGIKESIDDKEYGYPVCVKMWQERMASGPNNCYRNFEKMKKLCDNPCTLEEAYEHVKMWLKEKGIKENEDILVKVRW